MRPEGGQAAPESPARDDGKAQVNVKLPVADAVLTINGKPTRQTGTYREFVTPVLSPDRPFEVDLVARWQENGGEVKRSQKITVRPGQKVTIDFTRAVRNEGASGPEEIGQ
jgi:uncharacterized protein (TIGR03000 family)